MFLLLPKKKFIGYEPPTDAAAIQRTSPEWINACKGGPPTQSNFAYASKLTEGLLVGLLAVRVGKKIVWDEKQMRADGCPEAMHLFARHSAQVGKFESWRRGIHTVPIFVAQGDLLHGGSMAGAFVWAKCRTFDSHCGAGGGLVVPGSGRGGRARQEESGFVCSLDTVAASNGWAMGSISRKTPGRRTGSLSTAPFTPKEVVPILRHASNMATLICDSIGRCRPALIAE